MKECIGTKKSKSFLKKNGLEWVLKYFSQKAGGYRLKMINMDTLLLKPEVKDGVEKNNIFICGKEGKDLGQLQLFETLESRMVKMTGSTGKIRFVVDVRNETYKRKCQRIVTIYGLHDSDKSIMDRIMETT